jgi:hypothetical protein
MGKPRAKELDSLIDDILTDAYGDEEQRWAFLQAFGDNIKTPCAAKVGGQTMRVLKFDYDGNDRVGITAKCRCADGSRYSFAACEVVLDDVEEHRYIAAYRRWMGLMPYPGTRKG